MKKTEGITKYEIQWQLIRANIKGSKISLRSKLEEVFAYYNETRTYDRWERVYNWLEGLERGYKASKDLQSINAVRSEMQIYADFCADAIIMKDYSLDQEKQLDILKHASAEAIKTLWIDLFKTNEKWLEKGYFHKECNNFMDWLFTQQVHLFDVGKYSAKRLEELRGTCKETKNTHKFFF